MSRSYSGTTEFDWELERVKDPATGELRAINDDDGDLEYEYFTIKVEGRSYFAPGRLYGPPENCYPDEGETEILSVTGPDGKDWEDKLTSDEKEKILDHISEKVSEDDDGPDPDDYYNDYVDDDRCDDYEPYSGEY